MKRVKHIQTKAMIITTKSILSFLFLLMSFVAFAEEPNSLVQESPSINKDEDAERDPFRNLMRVKNYQPNSPESRIAQLLLDVKLKGMTGEQFFKGLADIKGPDGKSLETPMVMVNNVKTAISEAGGDLLLRSFLGERFPGKQGTPVEALILGYRRELTLKAIGEVIKDPAIRNLAKRTNSKAFLAFVGKWATQAATDFTFSGDIDFSFLGGNPELIKRMRDLFDKIIQRETGLTMKQLDSFATAHGFATSDVYVEEAGRKYGDDEIVKGMVDIIDFEKGERRKNALEGVYAILQSVLEETARETQNDPRAFADTYIDNIDKRTRAMTEPALSMEMIRHLEHDIIRNANSMPAMDTIVKGSKYLFRSNTYSNKEFPGRQPSDARLEDFTNKLTEAAKKASPAAMAETIMDFFTKSGIAVPFDVDYVPGADGKPKAILRENREKARQFLDMCMKSMWENVHSGLRARIGHIERTKTELEERTRGQEPDEATQRDMESFRKYMMDAIKGIKTELGEFEKAHVEIPLEVRLLCERLITLVESSTGGRGIRNLSPEEMKELEMIKKLLAGEHGENSVKMAIVATMHLASRFIERTNASLDWLDDTLMGPMRSDPSFEDFIRDVNEYNRLTVDTDTIPDAGARTRIKEFQNSIYGKYKKNVIGFEKALNSMVYQSMVAKGVRKINVTMNEFINAVPGSQTAMKGLTTFNLTQEFSAYSEALAKDGMSGLAAEMIRRRVPFGSTAENIYQGKYLRASWDAVATIFPPLALPEAALGVAQYAYSSGVHAWWSSELELFVDGLYESAEFEAKVDDNAKITYKLKSVTYTKNEKKYVYSAEKLLKGDEFILDSDVNNILWHNLAESDPFLETMEELQKHENVGYRLREHFKNKYEERWKTVKKKFVINMIDRLEKRRNAEQAVGLGEIPEIFGKLIGIARNLEVEEKMVNSLNEEWDSNNLKALQKWLLNVKRTIFSQPLSETERNKAARVIMRYLEFYSKVPPARDRAEAVIKDTWASAELGKPDMRRHNQRILTGIVFLSCKPEKDQEKVAKWEGFPAVIKQKDEQELLDIKNESVKDAKLDTDFDKKIAAKLLFEDFWIYAIKDMSVPVISAESFKRARAAHEDARNKLVKKFRNHYALKMGMITVPVRQMQGADKTEFPVLNANVTLMDESGQITTLAHKGEGNYSTSGVKEGKFELIIRAEGFKAASGAKEVILTITVPPYKEGERALEPILVYLVPEKEVGKGLNVSIDPPSAEIKDAGRESTITLKPVIVPKKDSGRVSYQWAAGDEVLGSGTDVDIGDVPPATFSGKDKTGKTVKVTLLVIDEKKREGVGQSTIKVIPTAGLTVIFEDHPKTVTERDVLKLRVMEPIKTTGNYRYTWMRDGRTVVDKMTFDYFDISDFQGLAGKSVTFVVEVFDDKGGTGSAETTIKVTDPKPEVENLKVSVSPDYIKIKEDGDVELTCSVEPFKDSGKLRYYWAEYPEPTEKKTFRVYGKDTKSKLPVTMTVTVRVKDEKGREGEATANVYVEAKEVKVEPVTSKKWDDAISSASKDWKRLISLREEIEKIKPVDRAAIDKITAALQRLADESQQYLKDSLNYLTALKELDRLAFAELKKGVNARLSKECIEKKIPLCPEGAKECIASYCSDYINSRYFACLGDAGEENMRNQRTLNKKFSALSDSKVLTLYKEFIGSYDYNGYFTELDKTKTALGLPEPLPKPPVLKWFYSSPCAGAGDLGIKPSTGLEVSLSQYIVTPPLKPGGKVKLTATVKGGKPSYKYSWSGTPEGSGESVTYTLKDMGEQTITVDVTDMGDLRGTGKATIKVAGEKAEIKGLPNQVVYGTENEITVSVSGMSQSAEAEDPKCAKQCQAERACFAEAKKNPNVGCMPDPDCDCSDVPTKAKTEKIRVVWEADPSITFKEPVTSSPRTTALFDRMGPNGRIKIWAQVQKEIGGSVFQTIGEAEQKEVTVVPPKFKWSFVPEKGKGKVGEEVKVTIATEPKIDPKLINFKWDYPESSNRMEHENNASVIGFVPKDPKPFMLLVSPQVPYYKELIGGALKEEYQAGAYTVTVSKPYSIGSKPQIWKCDTQLGGAQKCGLVEVEGQFAVDQNISLKAEVLPAPQKTPIKYKWNVSPEGCRLHNDITQELTIDCSQNGSYTASVIVKDSDNVELGMGSGQVSITISQKQISESKKMAVEAQKDQKDKEEAQKKLNQALDALRQGKIDEAIKLAEEAAKTDRKLAEPMLKEIARECKKQGNDAIYNRDFKIAVKRLEGAVRLDPSDKEAKDKLAQAKKFSGIWPQVEQKAKEFDTLIAQKKVWSAHKKMLEIQDLQFEMSGGMSNPLSKKVTDDLNNALKGYNDFSQEASRKHSEYFTSQDWEAMLRNAQDMMKRELSPADEKEAQSRLAFAQQMLNEQKGKADQEKRAKEAADKLWQEGTALYDQKKPAEALNIFNESLKQWPDAKRQEYVKNLENAMSQNRANAGRLRSEGEALQSKGMLAEAVTKYRESLNYWPDPELEEHIIALENKIREERDKEQRKAEAKRLRDEGARLQGQGLLKEAVAKYRESLTFWPDRQLEDHIITLENKIREERDKEQRKAEAARLRDEGARLQGQGLLKEAVAKYRESLTYWPDAELERLIRELEERIARTPVTPPESGSGAEGTWEGSFNNYRGKMELNRTGNAWTGRMWTDLHGRWEQLTNISFDPTTGRLEFTRPISGATQRYSGTISGQRAEGTFTQEGQSSKYTWWAEKKQGGTVGSGVSSSGQTAPPEVVQPPAAPPGKTSDIFNNGNKGGVSSGPTSPTTFTLDRAYMITLIQNYHYFSGGAAPGTISLKDQSGRTYGPWQAKGLPGQGGVKNAYWDVNPNITLQPGTYTVIDSNPKTWSQNSESKGRGFTRVEGYPAGGGGVVQKDSPASGGKLTVTLHNVSRENVHLYEKGGSPSASNRLTPGQWTTVQATIRSGWIEFCAGRGGKDIECEKRGVDADYAGYTYTVKFDESNPHNKVLITKGLK